MVTALGEVLGHFEADEAPAQHHGRRGRVHARPDRVHVGEVAQHVSPCDTRDRWPHRSRSGDENSFFIGDLDRLIGTQIEHRHGPRGPVDRLHRAPDPDVEPEPVVQALGRLQQQGVPVGDGATEE